jgi:non-canonical (house-cleaning) NTP pyrophosphatase
MPHTIIVIGSLNPVKVEAVRLAAADIYAGGVECSGVNAGSDVPDQVGQTYINCIYMCTQCKLIIMNSH